jgi:hypothetical protein
MVRKCWFKNDGFGNVGSQFMASGDHIKYKVDDLTGLPKKHRKIATLLFWLKQQTRTLP